MRHCGWCGKFLRADAQPIPGVNRYGEHKEQLLCEECGPHWEKLSASNQEHLATALDRAKMERECAE